MSNLKRFSDVLHLMQLVSRRDNFLCDVVIKKKNLAALRKT